MTSYLKSWTHRRETSTTDEGDVNEYAADEKTRETRQDILVVGETDAELQSGTLTLAEDAAGGMGRHLGVFSCTLLIVGKIIGTGIFSTPSSILGSVGSVGASLMLWVFGFLLSFCGLFIWLEFGTMIPRSGGEKVYLEAAYKRPPYLATTVFAVDAILTSFSSANCIVFANNIVIASGHQASEWVQRGIAIGVISFVVLLHGIWPRGGIYLMNSLSIFKIGILLFIVVTGWVVLSGRTHIQDPHANFRNAFANSSHSSNNYATAMFKILFSYSGWSNVNYVMNNVKDPVRTLKIAGPLGLGICATLYILANIAYFSATSKDEILSSGTTVASLFFKNVFGVQAQRALTVFVALSALGNIVTVTFAWARVIQELAKEGIPFPFGNHFWASNWPTKKSPFPGLLVNFIMTIIIILAPPAQVAYPFILDVQGYPQQIINFFVVLGLFWLRWRQPNVPRPFKVFLSFAFFYLASTSFLLVAPFVRPSNGVGDTPPLPYYLYSLVGIAIFAFSVIYWAGWRIIMPKLFGYELVPRKDTLPDGTVLTVFTRRKTKQQ